MKHLSCRIQSSTHFFVIRKMGDLDKFTIHALNLSIFQEEKKNKQKERRKKNTKNDSTHLAD